MYVCMYRTYLRVSLIAASFASAPELQKKALEVGMYVCMYVGGGR